MKMNVRFEYLYRDGGNYKNWGEVVFRNPRGHSIDAVSTMAGEAMIDRTFFEAEKAGIPDLRFEDHDAELDHDWHEAHSFTVSNEAPNDQRKRSIDEFIGELCAIPN